MKTAPKTKGFICSIIITIIVCVLITLYCIAFGESWTRNLMVDTVFHIQAGQIISALIIAVILVFFRATRENGLWFIIPLILIAFSFLYDVILNLVYPCC